MSTFNPEGLNFSESALNHFKQMLDTRGKGAGIKIGVKEAGCSGYEYTFDFAFINLHLHLDMKSRHLVWEISNIFANGVIIGSLPTEKLVE